MAFAELGAAYINLGRYEFAVENTTKAYELRDRVSEREKFFIESAYFHSVIGDLERARLTNELWAQTYPRDDSPSRNLSVIYGDFGQCEKALAQTRESLRLDPRSVLNLSNFVDSLMCLGRLEEARSAVDAAQIKNLDSSYLRVYLYQISFLRKDTTAMADQVAWGTGKSGVEDIFFNLEANTAAFYGQLEKARGLSRRAVASSAGAGNRYVAATYEGRSALREALLGNQAEVRQRVSLG